MEKIDAALGAQFRIKKSMLKMQHEADVRFKLCALELYDIYVKVWVILIGYIEKQYRRICSYSFALIHSTFMSDVLITLPQSQSTNPLILEFILPMLQLCKTSLQFKTRKTVFTRATAFLQNRSHFGMRPVTIYKKTNQF